MAAKDDKQQPAAKPPRPKPFKVIALKDLQYGHLRRPKGSVFTIAGDHHFRERQMRRVAAATPESNGGKTPDQVAQEKLALAVAGRLPQLSPNGADVVADPALPPAAEGSVELDETVLS